jgi:hypothetical protein
MRRGPLPSSQKGTNDLPLNYYLREFIETLNEVNDDETPFSVGKKTFLLAEIYAASAPVAPAPKQGGGGGGGGGGDGGGGGRGGWGGGAKMLPAVGGIGIGIGGGDRPSQGVSIGANTPQQAQWAKGAKFFRQDDDEGASGTGVGGSGEGGNGANGANDGVDGDGDSNGGSCEKGVTNLPEIKPRGRSSVGSRSGSRSGRVGAGSKRSLLLDAFKPLTPETRRKRSASRSGAGNDDPSGVWEEGDEEIDDLLRQHLMKSQTPRGGARAGRNLGSLFMGNSRRSGSSRGRGASGASGRKLSNGIEGIDGLREDTSEEEEPQTTDGDGDTETDDDGGCEGGAEMKDDHGSGVLQRTSPALDIPPFRGSSVGAANDSSEMTVGKAGGLAGGKAGGGGSGGGVASGDSGGVSLAVETGGEKETDSVPLVAKMTDIIPVVLRSDSGSTGSTKGGGIELAQVDQEGGGAGDGGRKSTARGLESIGVRHPSTGGGRASTRGSSSAGGSSAGSSRSGLSRPRSLSEDQSKKRVSMVGGRVGGRTSGAGNSPEGGAGGAAKRGGMTRRRSYNDLTDNMHRRGSVNGNWDMGMYVAMKGGGGGGGGVILYGCGTRFRSCSCFDRVREGSVVSVCRSLCSHVLKYHTFTTCLRSTQYAAHI